MSNIVRSNSSAVIKQHLKNSIINNISRSKSTIYNPSPNKNVTPSRNIVRCNSSTALEVIATNGRISLQQSRASKSGSSPNIIESTQKELNYSESSVDQQSKDLSASRLTRNRISIPPSTRNRTKCVRPESFRMSCDMASHTKVLLKARSFADSLLKRNNSACDSYCKTLPSRKSSLVAGSPSKKSSCRSPLQRSVSVSGDINSSTYSPRKGNESVLLGNLYVREDCYVDSNLSNSEDFLQPDKKYNEYSNKSNYLKPTCVSQTYFTNYDALTPENPFNIFKMIGMPPLSTDIKNPASNTLPSRKSKTFHNASSSKSTRSNSKSSNKKSLGRTSSTSNNNESSKFNPENNSLKLEAKYSTVTRQQKRNQANSPQKQCTLNSVTLDTKNSKSTTPKVDIDKNFKNRLSDSKTAIYVQSEREKLFLQFDNNSKGGNSLHREVFV